MARRWWRDNISQQLGQKKKELTNNPDVFSNAFIREGEERATLNTFFTDGRYVMCSGCVGNSIKTFLGEVFGLFMPRETGMGGSWILGHVTSLFFYSQEIYCFN